MSEMTESRARAVAAAHAELAKRAAELLRKYGRAICVEHAYYADFDPTDEEGLRLDIDGDVAALTFTTGGYESGYSTSTAFDARCLWSRDAIAARIRSHRRGVKESAAAAQRAKAERERAQYELLRRKFEGSDLRSDIRRAMQIEAAILAEDEAAELAASI